MLPDITILLITFNRPIPIRKTLDALKANLQYAGNIEYLIADDSTGGSYLADIARDYSDVTVSSTPRNGGWGMNANFHIAMCATDIFFMCEDDQVLTRKLDLNPGVALLLNNSRIGMIRYGGLAGHIGMNFTMFEQDIHNLVPTFEQGLLYIPRYQYLEINPIGGGYAAFTYSNRPNLRHKRFHSHYGYYLEGYRLGDTELEYTMRVREIMNKEPNASRIVVPIDWLTNHFSDIGDSYQHTAFDKGKRLESL